jgi:hypothetical protein
MFLPSENNFAPPNRYLSANVASCLFSMNYQLTTPAIHLLRTVDPIDNAICSFAFHFSKTSHAYIAEYTPSAR